MLSVRDKEINLSLSSCMLYLGGLFVIFHVDYCVCILIFALMKRDSVADERRSCSAGRRHEKLSMSKQAPVIHMLLVHLAICGLFTPKLNFIHTTKILAYLSRIAENQIDLFETIIVRLIASSNLTTCCHCGRKKSKLSQLCRHFSPAVQFQIEISL